MGSSKREELLNPSPPDTNPWKIKKVLLFVFAPPFLLTKIELDSNELFPHSFQRRLLVGKAKISFFHILEKTLYFTQSDGRVATRTYFSRSHDFPSRETIKFLSHFGLVYFCFSCFSRKILYCG